MARKRKKQRPAKPVPPTNAATAEVTGGAREPLAHPEERTTVTPMADADPAVAPPPAVDAEVEQGTDPMAADADPSLASPAAVDAEAEPDTGATVTEVPEPADPPTVTTEAPPAGEPVAPQVAEPEGVEPIKVVSAPVAEPFGAFHPPPREELVQDEDATVAEEPTTPVAEPTPVEEPTTPVAEPTPVEEPTTPVAEPTPTEEPTRVATVADTTEPASELAASGPAGLPVEGAAAWRRLFRMGLPRATKANVLGGLLAVLLGLAIATQVQLTQERGLSELSQTDLIRVLDDVSVRSSRLDAQIRELEATRDRLRSGTGSSAEALEQAQKRADTLGILAGTVGATGPGVVIRLSDPDEALTAPIILDLIQELRDAGAEAIDVGGVRVVASSFVGEIDGVITVDGVRIDRPIVVKAIGEAKTLSSAMTIPGGIVETVRQKGATATVTEEDSVEITSLHTAQEPRNARVVE